MWSSIGNSTAHMILVPLELHMTFASLVAPLLSRTSSHFRAWWCKACVRRARVTVPRKGFIRAWASGRLVGRAPDRSESGSHSRRAPVSVANLLAELHLPRWSTQASHHHGWNTRG